MRSTVSLPTCLRALLLCAAAPCLLPAQQADSARTSGPVKLDTVTVLATAVGRAARKMDVIGESELAAPDIIGGSVLNAVMLLRPQLLTARAPNSMSGQNEAAARGQLYYRASSGGTGNTRAQMPLGLEELDTNPGSMSVSVNEGPPGSPDILSVIPARTVREVRYLRPLDAAARFGIAVAGGPVLVVYTR